MQILAENASKKLCCTNYGDVFELDQVSLASTFNASTFWRNERNKDRMIDIQISSSSDSQSESVLFLSSNGNVFSFGSNVDGQCGVGKESQFVSSPRRLEGLSSNGITRIYCGGDCCFCVDKEGKLYCFGKNGANKMALDGNAGK